MKDLKRIAIGLPLVLTGICIVWAAISLLGAWSLLALGIILFSWGAGDAVISHRALRSGEREEV